MPKKIESFVVYNPQIDEFVKVKKFTDSELGELVVSIGKLIGKPGVKIGGYIRRVIIETVADYQRYDVDDVAESLFECVIEVYPIFQIDFVCKTLNEINELEAEPLKEQTLTLSQINKLTLRIKKKLIGQPEAVDECMKSIKLVSSGLGEFISLFFIGPTGVGKTELARLLAKEYLGNSKKLLKINCGEYSTGHEYAKLIGSPPGYVGHNEKGILSERAEQSSEWIILFDEIEKAHPKLLNLLLGFLDDGKLTDSHGTELEKEFKDTFSPEFINRLDGIVYFNQLTKRDAAAITRINLKQLPVRTTKQLVDYIVECSFSPEYGARNIKRFIRNHVTIKIAEKILEAGKTEKYKPVFVDKKFISGEEIE